MLKTSPAVFAVGNEYQIMVPVTCPSLFWVEIGEDKFYDEQNGIMRSLCTTHRVAVPMEILDRAGEYTVCERQIIDRKPYFAETGDVVRTSFKFYPVPTGDVRLYHISDTHSMLDEPVRAAKAFGKIDLLILNGDILNDSANPESFDLLYRIAEGITGGSIPTVFSRGNHDLRGYYAEAFAEYTPNNNGNTYYTFRIGDIWGLVLDGGEDKPDSHAEYGHTVSCHVFRKRQTEFIKNVIANSEREYGAEGVRRKLIVSHIPFSYIQEPPFDIEGEIYSEWSSLIRENIHPDLMLCGHLHGTVIAPVGGEMDDYGQPCTVIIGSDLGENYHISCGVELRSNEACRVTFCDSNGKTEEHLLDEVL